MRPLVFPLLVLAACATATPSAIDRREILVDDRIYTSARDTRGQDSKIDATVDAVWNATVAAYGELGIEIRHMDRPKGEVGNRSFVASRTIGGKQLGAYLNCGMDPFGGTHANSARIELSVMSTITLGDDSSSVLATRVDGTARRIGVSSDPLPCGSIGTLEAEIARRVRASTG